MSEISSLDAQAGEVEGSLFFPTDVELRGYELINFIKGRILKYSYEVYQAVEKLYWYDCFPYPYIPELAATDPHHKHIPPDIKHHRVPAPGFSFTHANLPFLIREIEGHLCRELLRNISSNCSGCNVRKKENCSIQGSHQKKT